ncbi:perlucin-like [Haliotis cracherodii]|uniref:perlucin-like n=1 Tax=Haliotis cracherodii TaxID=6455 RepID=UPI0039ED70FE
MEKVLKYLSFVSAFVLVAGQGSCPLGYASHSESCYKMFPLAATWPEAVVFCKTFGAKLSMITDQQEQDFVENYINGLHNSHLTQDIWLGGSDLLVNQEWLWTNTMNHIQYSNWKPGEPNNVGSGASVTEDCLALMPSDNYQWNDAPCTDRMYFLCETELGSNPIG